MISFSQPGFMGSTVLWNTSMWQRRCIKEAFIPRKVTATFNILKCTPLHSNSPIQLIICLLPPFCSHTMLTNWSPPKTTNMAPTGALFGSQQRPDDNVGDSDNNAGNTPSKDTQFRQPGNQIHPPPRYSSPPSQPPSPHAPQFYHHATFNMTPSSQPSIGAAQKYPSCGPSWQAYDFTQGGYSWPQMFPPTQFTGYGPQSPGAPRVPPAAPWNNPVIRPTLSSSTAPGRLAGAPGRLRISLQTKWFQPAAEPQRNDVAGIANLPPLREISYDKSDA